MNLKPYLLASRPKTLPAALSPVIIGTAMAYADGGGHWPTAAVAAFGAIMIQIGTNYANDYFDHIKGSDDQQTRLGPLRATAAGLVKPRAMRHAFIIAYAIAAVAGIHLLMRAGWPVLIIGVLSILCGILYTGGPFPLGYNGLGDIFVFVFFGLVAVGGSYYVQALQINSVVLMAGIAPGLMSTAILAVNNLRDIDNDRRAGKKTLPVVLGASLGRLEYVLCSAIACCMPIILVLMTGEHLFSISAGVILVLALPQIRILYREQPGGVYNKVLARTGLLLFLFSVLFSIGWLL